MRTVSDLQMEGQIPSATGAWNPTFRKPRKVAPGPIIGFSVTDYWVFSRTASLGLWVKTPNATSGAPSWSKSAAATPIPPFGPSSNTTTF